MLFKNDVFIDYQTGELTGSIVENQKKLSQLKDVFQNEEARARMPQDTLVYSVQMHRGEREGKEGGLFFGTSFVQPGRVEDEYFMTRGHFHAKTDTAEYYWGLRGEGMLILMEADGNCRAERITPGSLHYIQGKTAHRIANTGGTVLAVGACWPSDAGHDYQTIEEKGFSARLLCINGVPALVEEKNQDGGAKHAKQA